MPAVSAAAPPGTPIVTRSGLPVGLLDRIFVEIDRGSAEAVVVNEGGRTASYLLAAGGLRHRRGDALVFNESGLSFADRADGGMS